MSLPPKTPAKPGLQATSTKTAAIVPVTAPSFKIKSKADREGARYIKFLVYADYGIGKTWLAGTSVGVPQMQDVIAIQAESGDLTWDSDDSGRFPFEEIDTINVTDYKTASKIHEMLRLHCDLRDVDTPEAREKLINLQAKFTGQDPKTIVEPRRYRTVIIDSLTELEQYCMMQLLNITSKTGLAEETQTAEWAEYKKQHTMMQRLVRAYRDLPMNVIFVCARGYIQDDSKRMLFSPQMTGKLSGQIQGFMDIVGYLTVVTDDAGKSVRRMFVQPGPKFAAKCRLSNYRKAYWDDPTLANMLKDVGMLKTT